MSGSPGRRARRAAARARAGITDPRARAMFDQVVANASGGTVHPNGPNVYTCETCGGHTVTRHADDGVTPAMLACRVGSDGEALPCGGTARSAFYPAPPLPRQLAALPVWEWYRPEPGDPVLAGHGMAEHVDRGGLALRGPLEPEWAPEMVS